MDVSDSKGGAGGMFYIFVKCHFSHVHNFCQSTMGVWKNKKEGNCNRDRLFNYRGLKLPTPKFFLFIFFQTDRDKTKNLDTQKRTTKILQHF